MQEESRLKGLLRNLLRPEVITLILVPLAALVTLASLGMLDRRLFGVHFWTSLEYLKFFGWEFVGWIGLAALSYLLFSVIAHVIERRRLLPAAGKALPATGLPVSRSVERLQVAKSFTLLTLMFVFALITHFIAMNALCQPDRQTVAWADNVLMHADEAVFGTYVPFELHENQFFQMLATPLIVSYVGLSVVMVSVLFALCVFQHDHFRQYAMAILVVMFLGLPGWYALPAVTPSEAYRLNKIDAKIPFDIAMDTAPPIVHLNPEVSKFLDRIEPNQSVPKQGHFFITSFPSMHVAWGMLAVWFGVALYSRSSLLLVPWGLLNAIGAIFTLQHYAVDVLGGAFVAAMAVVLVRGLVALETRCDLPSPKGYGIFGSIRKDAASVGRVFMPAPKEVVHRA